MMLQQPKAGEYILASGKTHTVREFATAAFAAAGFSLDWRGKGLDEKGFDAASGRPLVEVSKDYYRALDVDVLTGDASKADEALGWKSRTDFNDLVSLMVEADLKRLEVKG